MAKRLDQVLVIDVESTCWDGMPPSGQISEIIEIGLCRVDLRSLERLDRHSILVKPQRSEVSDFCTALTSITDEMLHDAAGLEDAVRRLESEFDSRNRLFASWGDYDRRQVHRNCEQYGLPYPFGPTHLNVKNLFSTALGIPAELALDAAFDRLGLTMDGRHHRGDDDAWNVAELLCLLMRRVRRAGT